MANVAGTSPVLADRLRVVPSADPASDVQDHHDIALMIDRAQVGREPSAAVIDSQTIKTPAAQRMRGYDGAKKTVGQASHRGRYGGPAAHGQPHHGDICDSGGAQAVLEAIQTRWRWIRHLFADSAYDKRQLLDNAEFLGFPLEIIKRTETAFVVLTRRWVVDRTIGWMTRHRRLMRDCEARLDISEAMIAIAVGGLLIRRLTHP